MDLGILLLVVITLLTAIYSVLYRIDKKLNDVRKKL